MKPTTKTEFDPVRLAAVEILCDFDRAPSPLPELIESRMIREDFSARDRAFVSNLVYGVVRFREQLDYIIGKFVSNRKSLRNRQKLNLLRLGAFQLMPESRVPTSAAINETVNLTRKLLTDGLTGFMNAVLRNVASVSKDWNDLLPSGAAVDMLSVKYAQSKWLVETLINDCGRDVAISYLEAFIRRLSITLRINRLRISNREFEQALDQQGISYSHSEFHDDYYMLSNDADLSDLKELESGRCFVQNVSSGIVAELLPPGPDTRILDMCAAPGGKAATLAIICGHPANITALEVDKSRFDSMRKNFVRLGLDSISSECADARSYAGEQFDAVLLDAPCSGVGTIAKHPEIKYTQNRGNIAKLSRIQSELLDSAARLVAKDGVIVYSVCTLTAAETVQVFEEFMEKHPNFNLDVPTGFQYHQFVQSQGCMLIPPCAGTMEGMFAFRVRKNG
ncbi:MAG: 16S rRNA (cytosine(967)-C(5))-methyltransferase RsmB [candidate division Zixibacteria bacterium]|nr:16S rRNA (cytosine(967)-C(5))-methyltransferase RsmB [candidate division Zixibacteria bacterium]MBU1470398.1 16S rRNA (cytosine(967)-C(5))-methyltransferase RsmB [candidate division Zixibacteria bacterium]MBU2624293.1 16S rRNA (cytosine(967)-C(5))-methyltransferase RsmB [candidate division Zixibacteria bacterium]